MEPDLLLPAALRNRTSYRLVKLAALIRDECAGALSSTGLSQHQHAVLCCLDEFGPACQKDIAIRLGIDGGDLVAFIDGLQGAGLITRERDSRDRRRQILTITAAGGRRLRQVEKLFELAEPGVLAALTGEQRAALSEAAATVLAQHAPQAWTEPGRPEGQSRAG
jgi:MarR family transcriptional regulator, lower aerobic nicotinate degradation pathway regulator